MKPKDTLQLRNKSQFWLQVAIFLFPVIIYSNTIGHGYALDDAMVITHNQFTQSGFDGLKDIFTTDSFTGFFKEKKVNLPGGRYRPLSIATFAVEYAFFGNSPHISHLINILLFALTGLILFRLLRLIFQENKNPKSFFNIPFLATLIFLAHPIHTEVVANIKGRDEILSLLFALFALYSALKYIDKKHFIWLFSGFVSLFVALLSKESAIAFILIVPLAIFFFRDVRFKTILSAVLPLIVATIAYLVIRQMVIGGLHTETTGVLMNNPFLNANGVQKFATIALTLGIYLKLLLWPHPLTFDYYPYHIELTGFANIWVIVALIVYASLFIYACLRFKQKNAMSFFILFFLISLFPISNIVVNVGTFMNERFVYQGSVAFVVGTVWFLFFLMERSSVSKVFSKQHMKVMVFTVIILSFSIVSFSRNFAWKNDYKLFLSDVKTSSNSAKSNCGAGGVLLDSALKMTDQAKKSEELTLAVQYLTKATTIDPTYSDVWRKLGTAQFELNGDINRSFRSYLTAIKYNHGDEASYANIHFLLSKCENADAKIQYYKELLALNPRRPDVNSQLGFLYGKDKRDTPNSIKYFMQSVSLDPKNKDAFKGLGAAYLAAGKFEESLRWLEKALAIDSLDIGTYKIMGTVALQMGDKNKADFFFSNANRLKDKNMNVK